MAQPDAFQVLKTSTKLSEYVGRFATEPLKAVGTDRYRTNCVAHGGDNPIAMSIDDGLGLWHCFTGECGGGTIIDLYMKMNGVDDPTQAVEGLAAELNVQLPDRVTDVPSAKRVYRALATVAEVATEYLLDSTDPEARSARRYLKERGVSKRIARNWGLGMLPSGRRAAGFLRAEINDVPALVEGAVLSRDESLSDSYFCPMNGRLLFPIMDADSRVVAFGARIVPDVHHSMTGKYVNTPETSVYSKSNVMYCMDLITDQTEEVVVVEGYLDAIGLNQSYAEAGIAGTTVALAACGTAVTQQHVEEIFGDVPNITMLFDGDQAGLKAVIKAIWMTNSIGDGLHAVLLESGQDPWDVYQADSQRAATLHEASLPYPAVVVEAQWQLLQGSETDLSAWLQTVVPSLKYSAHRDQLIADAARVIGRNPAEYKRDLAIPIDITTRRATVSTLDQAVSQPIKMLCIALLQLDPEIRSAVLAPFSQWNSRTERIVQNWLPASSVSDTKVLRKLAMGVDAPVDAVVDQLIASLMQYPERVDLTVLLRGIARSVLAAFSAGSQIGGITSLQIKNVRRSLEACKNPDDQAAVLAFLLDVAIDLDYYGAQSAAGSKISDTETKTRRAKAAS